VWLAFVANSRLGFVGVVMMSYIAAIEEAARKRELKEKHQVEVKDGVEVALVLSLVRADSPPGINLLGYADHCLLVPLKSNQGSFSTSQVEATAKFLGERLAASLAQAGTVDFSKTTSTSVIKEAAREFVARIGGAVDEKSLREGYGNG